MIEVRVGVFLGFGVLDQSNHFLVLVLYIVIIYHRNQYSSFQTTISITIHLHTFFLNFSMKSSILLLTAASAATQHSITTTTSQYFPLWLDPPHLTTTTSPWYSLIKTSAGQSFTNTAEQTINVNMGQGKGTIHLYADPQFQQDKDDAIRQFSGPLSRNLTGTIDRCGWPATPASTTNNISEQWQRRSTKMYEDFSNGLDPTKIVVGLQKGCCDVDKYAANPYHKNINIVTDIVDGVKKNVLQLTAYNEDNPTLCPGPKCKKDVSSSGTIATADIFASGRYEVRAKVPKASGLVWAMWTFHYEEHLPNDCSKYTCWCNNGMPTADQVPDACEFRFDGSGKPCKYETVCDDNQDGWNPKDDPPKGCLRPIDCAIIHQHDPDPQFLGNHTFGGWTTMVNHEIDIEIPANCVNTENVCNKDVPGVPGAKSCIGDFSTSNFNNYIYTQNSGSGPAYSNMCVKASQKDGTPLELVGDGKYHTYRFDWHTGSGTKTPGRVDFYFDDKYMGTNNAYVPTRGGRLYVAHWYPASKNNIWNGPANDWEGGKAGDGKIYTMNTLISSITVTPFNEDNDMMAVNTKDKPGESGKCTVPYNSKYPNCHPVWAPATIPSPGEEK